MCDLHEVKGCAVCAGLVRWEPPEPSEGKVKTYPDQSKGVDRIIADRNKGPAFVHAPLPKRTLPTWNNGKRNAWRHDTHRNRKRDNLEAPISEGPQRESAADMAKRLGVTL